MTDWANEIAIAVSVKQRLAAVDTEGLWPHHPPDPPATARQVAETESALGHSLDPDYKAFLLHANGWRGFFQDIDLFGSIELIGGTRCSSAKELLGYLEDVRQLTGCSTEKLLPIAASQTGTDLVLLTRSHSAEASHVLWIAGAPVERYPTFAHFFRGMIALNRYEADALEKDPLR